MRRFEFQDYSGLDLEKTENLLNLHRERENFLRPKLENRVEIFRRGYVSFEEPGVGKKQKRVSFSQSFGKERMESNQHFHRYSCLTETPTTPRLRRWPTTPGLTSSNTPDCHLSTPESLPMPQRARSEPRTLQIVKNEPKSEKSFVKSLCRFYSEIFSKKATETREDLSVSFTKYSSSPFPTRRGSKLRKSLSLKERRDDNVCLLTEHSDPVSFSGSNERKKFKNKRLSIELGGALDRTPLLQLEPKFESDEDLHGALSLLEMEEIRRQNDSNQSIFSQRKSSRTSIHETSRRFSHISLQDEDISEKTRLSPTGRSMKSQDSGFSDTAESSNQDRRERRSFSNEKEEVEKEKVEKEEKEERDLDNMFTPILGSRQYLLSPSPYSIGIGGVHNSTRPGEQGLFQSTPVSSSLRSPFESTPVRSSVRGVLESTPVSRVKGGRLSLRKFTLEQALNQPNLETKPNLEIKPYSTQNEPKGTPVSFVQHKFERRNKLYQSLTCSVQPLENRLSPSCRPRRTIKTRNFAVPILSCVKNPEKISRSRTLPLETCSTYNPEQHRGFSQSFREAPTCTRRNKPEKRPSFALNRFLQDLSPMLSPVLPELHHSALVELGEETFTLNLEPCSPRRPHTRPISGAVDVWLETLIRSMEPECMTYLHSKPVLCTEGYQEEGFSAEGGYLENRVEKIIATHRKLKLLFPDIYKDFAALNLVQINRKLRELLSWTIELLSLVKAAPAPTAVHLKDLPGFRSSSDVGSWNTLLDKVEYLGHRADELLTEAEYARSCTQNIGKMREILVDIGEGLAQLTDLYLETRLAPVARTIRLSAVHSNIQSCLRLLVGFGGLDYSEISLILSRLDTVRSLVALAVSSQSKHLRILALRALSSVCSTQEMIRDLEDCGGVEVVCGFLTSIPCTQTKVECAGILAQITSPWLLQDKRLSPSFRTWIPQIISGLVNLLQQYSNPLEESTSSCEHPEQQGSPSRPLSPLELDGEQLFLIYAALSHLCCLEPESTKLLIKENRIRTLIFEVGRKNLSSVNLVEQLINILEELSRTEKERMRTDENILRFLLNQVQNEDHKFQRIRNKSASILTSLASTPSVFNDVLLSGQLAQTARRASRRSRVVTSPLNKSKKTLSQSDQLASSHCVERRTSPGSKQVERRASVILEPDDRRASSTWNSVDQLASSPLLATQCGRLMQSVGNCSVYSFLNETIQL